jgi:type IV pilus assembly protein PilY1
MIEFMEVAVRTIFKKVLRPLLVALACGSVSVHGEDIDLFLGSSGTGANILFVIDNSSNWAANNQNWPTDTGSSGPASWCGSNCDKQGYYELKALYNLVSDAGILTDTMNVGLMMFNNSTSSRDGGYVRVAVAELGKLGENSHRDKLLGEIESAIRNFNTETTGSSVQYAATLFDAYKYFGGYSNPARTYPVTPAITNPVYDGIGVFGTAFWGDNDDDKYADKSLKRDASAYSGANYVPSINQYNNCAKNYIIFIGNGFPAADELLQLTW